MRGNDYIMFHVNHQPSLLLRPAKSGRPIESMNKISPVNKYFLSMTNEVEPIV